MEEVMTLADAAYHANKVITAVTPSSSRGPVMLLYSVPLLSALLAFAIAQFLKVITTWYKEKRWDPKKIVGSGGMPSSHSSTVVALAVSIGLHEGIDSSSFAIAVVMAFIVMYDATGVRLHAGRQAEVLNQIVCEFPPEHPLSTSIPLRDSLGHTPLQVVAGAMLGCIVAFLMKATD
ncbi:acid phosphatase/vanadium-dependent haloperoxidase-related protein [Artemisia annua]|uniref:Acid phosphatase/vanadium-dependent haloperoxidase-related protein n=1 Tax=Artemisia annua TaxID=35608 RepID=A0A2U1NVR5_ARTAN|nr:acid phosphatase/vanadium-dependent haloperoxidase-related protein [Artemisia annua]